MKKKAGKNKKKKRYEILATGEKIDGVLKAGIS